ncbi:MAG: DUF465 domain-containing protein [Thermoanaerobaculum sp.]|nr:DUF465 domain-containing protein [Thermoanaerobaculum sp.]
MSDVRELRAKLAQEDPEFRQLFEAHQEKERRLQELSRKGFLTAEEEQEEKRLKKEKLQLKDKMEALLRSKARPA